MQTPCGTFLQRLTRLSQWLKFRQAEIFLALALALLAPARLTYAHQTDASAAPQVAPSGAKSGVLPGAQGAAQPGATSGVLPPALSPVSPPSGATTYSLQSLVNTPTISPGALTLLEQDGRFSQAVSTGGGPAFAQWFADDAVTLNNGKPPVQGRRNITASATWKPADYQLTWVPQGASMGPSNDMGYTWGSYEGRARDQNGQTVTTAGRYITIWRKQPDGQWKIALEASADDVPGTGACCALPKP